MNGALSITINGRQVAVPALDIDARIAAIRKQSTVQLHPRQKVERRIVAALIAHLWDAGFKPVRLDGYDEGGKELIEREDLGAALKSAMELAFNLDDCRITFAKPVEHLAMPETGTVVFVFGNGTDCVGDWHYTPGGDFDRLMNAFDAAVFA